jgi:GTP-binding protein YchF
MPGAMRVGIIGLPQTGKTSLFRILTRAHLAPKQEHGAHIGIAHVPDSRLDRLAALYHSKKITYAAIEFRDVGGLVHDRARDSEYLVQVREMEALAHVVRLFENPAVPHPRGSVDPKRDIESVELDLVLYDLEQSGRRIDRLEKEMKKKKDPALEAELGLLARCRALLDAETPLRAGRFTAEEKKLLTGFQFLSEKPMLVVLNAGEEEAGELGRVAEKHGLGELSIRPGTAVVALCGKLEAELAELGEAEAAELMRAYGLAESGRDRFVHASYDLLGVISFLTLSEPECRAWTLHRGSTALEAAATVHTDIARGFVKAEVVAWDDLLAAGSWAAAREAGKVKLEGKEYVVRDGDVIFFRHSG